MKYLKLDSSTLGAEDSADAQVSSELLEKKLADIDKQLSETTSIKRAELLLDYGRTCLELERNFEAWQTGQQAFNIFVESEEWEGAVLACDVMFNADQPDSLVALGNGLWLAVTFPISPELSVVMLDHIIDETPDDSDGGAVAAAVAHYLVDLRAQDKDRENLLFFTNQLLGTVARRHSNVESQEDFEAWVKKLELDSPDDFFGRLGQVLNVMVQDDWWVDRDALRAKLPND
ncbi:hypothetical protein PN36_26780 [Candidatus Thiomargarita nelsonii]|uniref:Uncharacterized protein n=1 Tax=Candidatus Thiomargarita nelsonii TaxID=1003181 RepID=A0A0A6P5A5_9GAMM|nr:hypothetical protein PN36_26780 [Candidatus Thiomargarita nelsonii]